MPAKGVTSDTGRDGRACRAASGVGAVCLDGQGGARANRIEEQALAIPHRGSPHDDVTPGVRTLRVINGARDLARLLEQLSTCRPVQPRGAGQFILESTNWPRPLPSPSRPAAPATVKVRAFE